MYTIPRLLMWDFIMYEKYLYVYISFVKKRTVSSHNTQIYRTINIENLHCKVTTNQSIFLQTYTLLLQTYIGVEKNAAFGS